ncbi:MAG: HAMP domain-containing sensor histidine kinase [Phycisphaerae bacterium]|nr:HAMP domain-containing sensor histidine kinase [Phycisphaerae bacterium]
MFENGRLLKRAYWLIRLRWVAIAWVAGGTWFSFRILGIELQEYALYGIAILLTIYNTAMYLLLGRYQRGLRNVPYKSIKRIISFQICADLIILTILMHFSGGVENPFVFYFIFHMIIASILLSVKESYLQATFAVLLFGLLLLLEYMQIIPHHCLKGFVINCLHRDGIYVFGTFFAFTTAMYLVVYMTSYISLMLKRAEHGQRLANMQLREKDRIKDEYVERVTHDIKGHLAAIQNCLDVVVDGFVGTLNDCQADFIHRAHSRTVKLSVFVRTLLKLTNMRLNNNMEIKDFSLKEVIDDAVATVEARAEEKSIILSCHIDLPEDKVSGDQFSIEEMITNLILNAIKYTPPKGHVSLIARNDMDSILVEISDTGIGIPKEELKKIFEEFYRASNARKVVKDGTGLGLSIAKQIVERHKGTIWVESEEGVGASFKFTLPKSCVQNRNNLKETPA